MLRIRAMTSLMTVTASWQRDPKATPHPSGLSYKIRRRKWRNVYSYKQHQSPYAWIRSTGQPSQLREFFIRQNAWERTYHSRSLWMALIRYYVTASLNIAKLKQRTLQDGPLALLFNRVIVQAFTIGPAALRVSLYRWLLSLCSRLCMQNIACAGYSYVLHGLEITVWQLSAWCKPLINWEKLC